MKRILIYLIRLYQKMPLASHGACHFYPTCSNYTIEAIEEYGSIKGCFLGVRRILRCHPNARFGYDPVIRNEGKKNEKKY